MTGAEGFIGSHLLKEFENRTLNDHIFILGYKQINGYPTIDYKDFVFSKNDFAKVGLNEIDVLLILGGHIEKKGELHPVRNHLGSINSVDYLLNNLPFKPKKVIFCSSVSVYGYDENSIYKHCRHGLIDEQTAIKPVRAYALSKVMCEKLVDEWCHENNVNCQILRLGSVYYYEKELLDRAGFIYYLLKAYFSGAVFNLYSHPKQLWNYVFIDDVCNWIINSFYLEECPGVINLTADKNLTTKEIVTLFKKNDNGFKYAVSNNCVYKGTDKSFDSSKRKEYLGNEKHPFEKVVRRIVGIKKNS